MSNCPTCDLAFDSCECTSDEITQGYADQDKWYRFKNLNADDMKEMEQNKEDARLYSALKHIIQSNLMIPHNLTSKPDDECPIDYQARLKTAQMITSEFKKLTGKDIDARQLFTNVRDESC